MFFGVDRDARPNSDLEFKNNRFRRRGIAEHVGDYVSCAGPSENDDG